jgi:hypothetical protein
MSVSDESKILCWESVPTDKEAFPKRMNWYSNILHDDDFENYQPFCYADSNSDTYKKEKLRSMWIRIRFCQFGSIEWSRLDTEIQQYYEEAFPNGF